MICKLCGHIVNSFSIRFLASGEKIIQCRSCRSPHVRQSVHNPFASLELTHAIDESGNPICVSSLRQLQDAEKRYGFRSLVANVDSADHDKPPQHQPRSVLEQMNDPYRDAEGSYHDSHWMFPEVAREIARDLEREGEIQ